MLIKEIIAEIVRNSLNSAVKSGMLDEADFPKIKIEYPKEERFGDYAAPLALEAARILRRSPIEIGNVLQDFIEASPIIERVDVVKPGYINIFLSLDFLYKTLITILNMGENYGKTIREVPLKVNIEFVSANPTGPLNIVSARASAVGDTLANIIEAGGYEVHREFYVNDYGNQVYLLGESVLSRYREMSGEDCPFPEDGYHGKYISDIARYIMEDSSEEFDGCTNDEERINYMAEKAVEYNVSGQKCDLENFNVFFDTWFYESALHRDESVESTLERLESSQAVISDNGKRVFRSSDYGDDKDRVVVRDDGRPTYFLADIAYHKNKIDRGFGIIIDIWGPDHHGYIARMKGAMKVMGFEEDRFRILIAQQVNLIKGGETVKMSKRLGNFSTMKDLIEEIGVDVARYFFIMRSMESHLDFDLALAKRESSENPVFYLQYAHARICSLFVEAEKRGIEYNPQKAEMKILNNREAIALLKILARFPQEIRDAAENLEPHLIANYLLRLAQSYHRFYTEHIILSDNDGMTSTYLSLCQAVRIVLRNGLGLLGVSTPERM